MSHSYLLQKTSKDFLKSKHNTPCKISGISNAKTLLSKDAEATVDVPAEKI